jgi:hypothetical protein
MQESVFDILRSIPVALSNESGCVYILIKDIPADLENFILTGLAETDRFQLFPDVAMRGMAARFEESGLTVECVSQRMEYMHRTVTVRCPRISAKGASMKVSLIPWFTLPGRPYPVFAYIYAIWHYNVSEKKSQRLSAAATGKAFGIGSFNKSTVCRNIKAMEGLCESIGAGVPTSGGNAGAQASEDLIERIPEILKGCATTESLKEMLGGTIATVPESVNNTQKNGYALMSMPKDFSEMIVEPPPAGNHRRDTRKRPPRPYRPPEKRVQRPPRFASSAKIGHIRRGFIVACMPIVMDYATAYHKFLL